LFDEKGLDTPDFSATQNTMMAMMTRRIVATSARVAPR
jgi:hypothetical protein